MDSTGIAGIITAVGGLGVLVPIVNHFIKKSERRFEEKLRLRDEQNRKEREAVREAYGLIYRYLWKLLFEVNGDRVFLIQPHPLSEKQFISVSLEIIHPDRDVVEHKERFQFMRMSEWAGLVSKLNDDWMIYRKLDDIKDGKIYAEAHRRGVKTLSFRKLVTDEGHWKGNLCLEYTHSCPETLDFVKGEMDKKAKLIQGVLPEYSPSNIK